MGLNNFFVWHLSSKVLNQNTFIKTMYGHSLFKITITKKQSFTVGSQKFSKSKMWLRTFFSKISFHNNHAEIMIIVGFILFVF